MPWQHQQRQACHRAQPLPARAAKQCWSTSTTGDTLVGSAVGSAHGSGGTSFYSRKLWVHHSPSCLFAGLYPLYSLCAGTPVCSICSLSFVLECTACTPHVHSLCLHDFCLLHVCCCLLDCSLVMTEPLFNFDAVRAATEEVGRIWAHAGAVASMRSASASGCCSFCDELGVSMCPSSCASRLGVLGR